MGPPAAVAAVRLAVRTALADVPAGETVLVACSGGADSLALAAALAFEAERLGLRAGGVTVDHGLQPGSDARAAQVVSTLTTLGLAPVGSVRVSVGTAGGPEAAARMARYAALDAVAEAEGAAAVLLGHSRDDQAETVLLGLARGSGARSLGGMPARAGRYRRPLLDLPRSTMVAACAESGIEPWQDPHNEDRSYARVRVRLDALPALEQALGPGIADALARSARLLRDDADALDGWASAAYDESLVQDGSGQLAVMALVHLPAAVRRRVLRRAALAAGCPASDLTAGHVDAVERLVVDWHGQGPLDLPGGRRALRTGSRIVFTPADPARTRPQQPGPAGPSGLATLG